MGKRPTWKRLPHFPTAVRCHCSKRELGETRGGQATCSESQTCREPSGRHHMPPSSQQGK